MTVSVFAVSLFHTVWMLKASKLDKCYKRVNFFLSSCTGETGPVGIIS